MSKCVIISGADINNYERVKSYFSEEDYFIFCDSGLKHKDALGVTPSLIVGDFDSHNNPHSDTETIVLPCEKDDTDSVFGVKEGIKRGFDEFLIIGAIGARFDHSFVNVSILLYLDSLGKKGRIVDDYCEMETVSTKTVCVEDRFSYFSLLNVTGKAKGITVKNAKYPLENAEITSEYQYGISNEVLTGKTAEISLCDGKLLLVKVF